jgi:hypothetical protein
LAIFHLSNPPAVCLFPTAKFTPFFIKAASLQERMPSGNTYQADSPQVRRQNAVRQVHAGRAAPSIKHNVNSDQHNKTRIAVIQKH